MSGMKTPKNSFPPAKGFRNQAHVRDCLSDIKAFQVLQIFIGRRRIRERDHQNVAGRTYDSQESINQRFHRPPKSAKGIKGAVKHESVAALNSQRVKASFKVVWSIGKEPLDEPTLRVKVAGLQFTLLSDE